MAETPETPDRIRENVQQSYGRIARTAETDCCATAATRAQTARRIGYSDEEIGAAPEGANLGLGCGNPTAIDSLRPGEVVLDLGSGAGFDAFLAARQVGPEGRVIGVDMTDDMLAKARVNAEKAGFANVEFRKGHIEQLPVESESVDAVISNCVINLSPEKDRVFAEALRVLRPGGRLMVSDVVLARPLPEALARSAAAYVGCIGGASVRPVYLETIRKAGFRRVEVVREARFAAFPDDIDSLDDPRAHALLAGIGVEVEQARKLLDELGLEIDAVRGLLEGVTSISVRATRAAAPR